MILSGRRIQALLNDKIFIDPFNSRQLNPNSYNLCLHNEVFVYEEATLDLKKEHQLKKITIPESGLLLEARKLYLGRTVEHTRTEGYVPMLEGRSSVGRLGLNVHVTAGFGDVGFSGYWTLEMHCIHPIKIYPHVQICQIFYHSIEGDYDNYQSSKYQNNTGVQKSMFYKEFKEDK